MAFERQSFESYFFLRHLLTGKAYFPTFSLTLHIIFISDEKINHRRIR
jgi:hypothetical protein